MYIPGIMFSLFVLAIPIALLVAYIVALVWVYRDADVRNMNPIVWLLIALFVPFPIGFIIYLVVRTNPTSGTAKVIRCKNCNHSIDATSNVCPYCGYPVRKTCPNCGRPVNSDWRNCPDCGTNLYSDTYNRQ